MIISELPEVIIRIFPCPGATFTSVFNYDIFKEFIDFQPELVIVFLGSNDIKYSRSNITDVVIKDAKYFLSKIKVLLPLKFEIKIIEIEPRLTPRGLSPLIYTRIRNGINKKLAKLVDCDVLKLSKFQLNLCHISADGVHFNHNGRYILQRAIVFYIKEIFRVGNVF
jgi:lysophospholipase L1-like esterase